MIDNFSEQAEAYARFRPVFPENLIKDLADLTDHDLAWDIATGNGQVAVVLARYFHQVVATDMSAHQLEHAQKAGNVVYRVEAAEDTSLEDQAVNLAVVAQAAHWFDLKPFYKEIKRVLVPGGVLALIGYALMKTGTGIDEVVRQFHDEILGEFWDPQRRYVDEEYSQLPFPFEEVTLPGTYQIRVRWTLSELLGYLSTWSAVRHYIRGRNQDPIALIVPDIMKAWPAGSDHVDIVFPVFMRVGRV